MVSMTRSMPGLLWLAIGIAASAVWAGTVQASSNARRCGMPAPQCQCRGSPANPGAGEPRAVRQNMLVEMDIAGFAFSVPDLFIALGTTLRWTNRDGLAHNTTSQTAFGVLEPSGLWDSGLLESGMSFQYTFQSLGEFYYYCQPHGTGMQGRVTVALAGDANVDGVVDVADLGLLASNWQRAGIWQQGDFDGSGFVDVEDLGLLASNWQAGDVALSDAIQQTLNGVAVPEVSTVWAALLLAAALRRRPV